MSSIAEHRSYSLRDEPIERGWVARGAGVAPNSVDDDAWLEFADEQLYSPGNVVVVAISRRKLHSPRGGGRDLRGGRDLLAGFTGEDSAPDITAEMSEAVARERID